jgi:hypothetical protein
MTPPFTLWKNSPYNAQKGAHNYEMDPLHILIIWRFFLTNAVPHFVSGVMGYPFQSPFANPPGEGLSS